MFNTKVIIKILGHLLIVEGIAMLAAFGVALFYKEPEAIPIMKSSLICISIGVIAVALLQNAKKGICKNDGFLIVSLAWVVLSLFGSLPYLLSGSVKSLTDAFFETMSGFTTTGASVMTNIESLSKGILFWRSLTQWLGGLGIIILSLIILPVFGIGGIQLFSAEVPGPVSDKMIPKIQQTLKNIGITYILLSLIETVLLRICGMTLFDAVNHSLTTISTGGFSTKQASIEHWNSPLVQYIIIFFMLVAGTNFTLTYSLFTKRKSWLYKNEEFKYYIGFIIGFTCVIFSGLLLTTQLGFEKAFRDSLFQVVSIITTTGYVTTDYRTWIPFLKLLIFILFFIGASTGSTGGGIKIMRVVLLLKNSYYELRRLLHPNAVIPVRMNRQAVPELIITNVLSFFMIYFSIFFFSTIILSIMEPDLHSAMGAVASCMANIGPGLGHFGPTNSYYYLPSAGKWFLSFLMVLGRLELFTVLVLFSGAFWKK